ncbi:MAG: 23S rRNA (guanosine(2251)-2'-O)-methyltransferase RlmB [Candidatus Kapabacteria bacterium]|nr:23S rRNA (guanosine(2251)-2'-O)-methyltransferase RlmB [Candidatus Kapabacteria bacterium]
MQNKPEIVNNYYIYGRNSVIEAINSERDIEKIYVSFSAHGDSMRTVFSAAKQNKIPITVSDKFKFGKLENEVCPKGTNSQGVIALVSPIKLLDIDTLIKKAFSTQKYPLVLVLDGIYDPQNLGAIARSCECGGAAGLILPTRESAPITPVAVKASAGALEHILVTKVPNLINSLKTLKDNGFWVVGTEMNADEYYFNKSYDMPIALVIGSEGKGISPGMKKHCDFSVKIPLSGKINSLNASVSAGILIYEIVRQRLMKS